MARGNDGAAAAEELKAKLGGMSGNAADMIALSDERWPAELRAASNRRIDEKATEELDDDKAQGFVGDREVLGYAVRGPFLVVVSSDDDGFVIKQAFPLDEKKAERATATLKPVEPKHNDDEDNDDEDDKSEEKAERTVETKSGTAKATATATTKK